MLPPKRQLAPVMYGNVGGMEKTTVYLTTEQKAALARAADAEGRSEARLIREGIDAVTSRHRAGETIAVVEAGSRAGAEEAAPDGARRPRWISRDEFVRRVLTRQADPGLREELAELTPGTTDDGEIR
jgi:hypothetical protein